VGALDPGARVTKIIIDATTSVAGHPSYEQLTGRAFGELDELQRRIEREPAACWRIARAILKANINA
jgi:hypothetical protein